MDKIVVPAPCNNESQTVEKAVRDYKNTLPEATMDRFDWIMVSILFLICAVGAYYLPIELCPDESGRRLLSDFMFNNGFLPKGNEPEVILPGWGFSYALRPYLSSILAAFCMKIGSLLHVGNRMMLVCSRMCSILSVSGCCYFSLKTGMCLFKEKWMARLYAALICFIPQVLFLGMYQNNDSLSLAAVSFILYSLCVGRKNAWSIRDCVRLGISISFCLLSYYSAYGWILASVFFCICSCIGDKRTTQKTGFIINRGILIAIIVLFMAGWFFIRNAILNGGDFLGIAMEKIQRERYGMVFGKENLYNYGCMYEQGIGAFEFLRMKDYEWIRMTFMSFVGVFGYMVIYMPSWVYTLYVVFFILGCAVFLYTNVLKKKQDWVLNVTFLCGAAITIFLHFYQSYYRDYQPQGRYVITLIIPLAYMVTEGWTKLDIKTPFTKKERVSEENRNEDS